MHSSPLSPVRPGLSSLRGLLGLALAGAALLAGVTASAPRARAQATEATRPPVATQRLVFALYYYGFQGDPRKPTPTRDVRDAKGVSLMVDHPWESVGPWFSYDRAQWHKNQFQMMAAGGVDVALAVYRGDTASRKGYALKGLDMMTQGLKELRSEGTGPFIKPREYPQLALALDLGGLAQQLGGPVDLKQPEAQRNLYGMIRDFYRHIPEEFRASVQLPSARQGAAAEVGAASTPRGLAYIVRLLGEDAVKDADNSALTYVNGRFAKEFGARLLWVGTPGLRDRMTALDAVAPHPAATSEVTISEAGWIRTGSLGPGYDASARIPNSAIRPRNNGGQTIIDFRKMIDAAPEWVFLDSWNGYHQGTDIAPSLEYGLLYRDLVRAGVLQFKRTNDYAVTFTRASVPRVMQPGVVYQVDVTAQNTGENDWDAITGVALSYRWLQNGKVVGDTGAQVTTNGLLRGETKSFMLGVAPPIHEGKPLAPGQYELEFDMNRRVGNDVSWFNADGSQPYRIPVTIGPGGEGHPFWVTNSLTTLLQQGAEYPAEVRVRNDGSETWKKGTYSLVYRWRKVNTYLKGGGEDADTVVAEGKRVALPDDIAPGRLLDLKVTAAAMDAAGKPLPAKDADEDYVLEWDLHNGNGFLGASGAPTYRETVNIVERDPGPYFVGCNLPSELIAGRTEKITVGLFNRGPNEWKKDRDKVVVHWYYMDGTEASWTDDTLPLVEDVPAFSKFPMQLPDDSEIKFGGTAPAPEKKGKKKKVEKAPRIEVTERPTVLRDVPVRVPYYFGPMYCVFDFQSDGKIASTSAATKGNDVLVIPVNVYSPTFTPVPLNSYFNVDGVSQDVDRSDGNIDGRGNSLPAEFLPPYVPRPAVSDTGLSNNPLYPSGLWVRPLNELSSTRTCFLYPPKVNSAPNMVSCQGQQLPTPPLPRNAVHLLALATEEEVTGDVTLFYGDNTRVTKQVAFTHWNDAPKHGEKVAFMAAHRHTAAGDDAASHCYLNQYTLEADPLKQLVGIELPRQPAVKVMAITLESATLRNPGGGQ